MLFISPYFDVCYTLLLSAFIDRENFLNLIKTNTFFKGGGPCIDLISKNRKHYFKNKISFESGPSIHHHLIYSMLEKNVYEKEESTQIVYSQYKS